MINKWFDSFTFYFSISANWYVLFSNTLARFFQIQEFPLVHGHKCWSVPTKCSPLSPQTGIQIRDWASMRWPMSSQCWWVIYGDCCDIKKHLGRCSGYEKYLDNWTAPFPLIRTVFSHGNLSPRCHMLSSTLWCNMDPSFHEYESYGHKLLQKWHHNSLPPSH